MQVRPAQNGREPSSLVAKRMTEITCRTAVNIPGHAAVLVSHPGLGMRMACDAGKFFIIARNMAIAAVGTGVFSGPYGERVIENGLCPGNMGRIMTQDTVCGKASAAVAGIGRVIIICGVAAITVSGQIVALVMTGGTAQADVGSL